MILLDKLHSQIYLYMLFTKDLGVFEDGCAVHRYKGESAPLEDHPNKD